MRDRKKMLWSLLIGSGIALFPIHNQWLTRLATDANGVNQFFLPAFGMALWLIGSALYLVWGVDWKQVTLGAKQIYIPLAVISGAIILSSVAQPDWGSRLSQAGMGAGLFVLYIASRQLDGTAFLPLGIGAGTAAAGVVVTGMIINPGHYTGGLVFERNFDILTGYTILGTILITSKWKWLLAGLCLTALFLSGAAEAVFAVAVMLLIVIVRKDLGKKVIIAAAPAITIAALWFGMGYGQQLWLYSAKIAVNQPTVDTKNMTWLASSGQTSLPEAQPESPTSNPPTATADLQDPVITPDGADYSSFDTSAVDFRLLVIENALTNLRPFGIGYTTNQFKHSTVHNVPLIIVQQLGWPGIAAGVAWLFVVIWGVTRTKWKYAWSAMLVLSIWDHFTWTQMAPVFWMLAGMSSASDGIKSDLIFHT